MGGGTENGEVEHEDKYKDNYKDKYKDKYNNNRQTYGVLCFWKGGDQRSLIMKNVQIL